MGAVKMAEMPGTAGRVDMAVVVEIAAGQLVLRILVMAQLAVEEGMAVVGETLRMAVMAEKLALWGSSSTIPA